MRLKSALAVLLVVLLLNMVGMSSCAKPAAPPEVKTLKFGVAHALSGPASFWGLTEQHIWGEAMAMINEEGGFTAGGQRYVWEQVWYDTQFKPELAVTAVERLISEDNIKFICAAGTACLVACVPALVKAGVFGWHMATPTPLSAKTPYQFTYCAGVPPFIHEPLYSWASKELGVKTMSVITMDDYMGDEVVKWTEKLAPEFGLNFKVERYVVGTKDFYPILTRVVAYKPDMIWCGLGAPGANVLILKQARELGYKGVIVGYTTSEKTVLEVAGAGAGEGFYDIGVFAEAINPKMKAVEERQIAKYGKEKYDPGLTLQYHDSIAVLTKAIEKADSIEPAKVAEAAYGMEFDTILGPGYMAGKELYGFDCAAYLPVGLCKMVNGKYTQADIILPPKR